MRTDTPQISRLEGRLSGVKVANDELELSRERGNLTGEDATASKSSLEATKGSNEARGVAAQHGKIVLGGSLDYVTGTRKLTLSGNDSGNRALSSSDKARGSALSSTRSAANNASHSVRGASDAVSQTTKSIITLHTTKDSYSVVLNIIQLTLSYLQISQLSQMRQALNCKTTHQEQLQKQCFQWFLQGQRKCSQQYPQRCQQCQ
jgi:hypothetical protein